MPVKQCSKCKIRPVQDTSGYCLPCKNAWRKQWKKKNPHRVRNAMLKWRYGISVTDIDGIFKKQKSRCAACDKKLTIATLKVDHCHSTGIVRGILCHNCNITLGLINDDPVLLRKLAKYVAKHKK